MRFLERKNKLILLKPSDIHSVGRLCEDVSGLAESIRYNGVLSPLLVRRSAKGYELICGRRRYFAAIAAGVRKIPCLITDADDKTAAIIRLTEKIHRSETDIYSVALEADGLMREFRMSYHEAAGRLGMTQPELAELLGTLRYTEEQFRRLSEKQNTKKCRERAEPEPQKSADTPKPSKIAVNDIRLFTNSLDRVIAAMREAGFSVKSVTGETEDYVEYTVRAEKSRKAV